MGAPGSPSSGETDPSFVADYAAALRRHLAEPGEAGLHAAYDLGRRALTEGVTLLELVVTHHSLRGELAGPVPTTLIHADEFLREGLGSFELAELGYWEAQRTAAIERERVEVLDRLNEAHLAVLAVSGLHARLRVLCDRAVALVGGARARVELAGTGRGARTEVERGDPAAGSPPARVPIPARTGIGVLEVWPQPGGFLGAADRAVLAQYALLASGAIDDARRLELARASSLQLQRSLLPGVLPHGDHIDVAARYLASERANQVGGDWYDLIQLEDDCFVAVVGDVMGHGLREASLMAAMRVAFHAYSIEGVPASSIMERVDRLFSRLAPDHLATAVLFVLDLKNGHMSVVNAGHPPPVQIDADGTATLVELGRSLPLGVRPDEERPDPGPFSLQPGTKLLLYTDGLTERIDRAGGDADTQLLAATQGFRGSVDELCERVLAAMMPDGRSGDDTCLLAIGIR